jgi:sn-glycerol 3-phosphate transport system permease protein
VSDAGALPGAPAVRLRSGRRVREALVALAALAPALAVFATFYLYPLYELARRSLFEQNRFGTAERYVGLDNWNDETIRNELVEGLRISGTYVLYTVPIGLVLGVLLAVAAHRRLRGIKIFQGIFSSTIASSVAVASVVFFVLIHPRVGYFGDVAWLSLSDPDTALRGVALSSIWQNLGLTFVIVLAGLQTIPDEIVEAATLDGFGPVRRFFRVTLPLLSPTLLFLVVVLVIFAFQAYAQVDILTGGGPNGATETMVFKIFLNSQQPALQGQGAVLSIGLFVVTLVVSLAQFLILERRVHYGG